MQTGMGKGTSSPSTQRHIQFYAQGMCSSLVFVPFVLFEYGRGTREVLAKGKGGLCGQFQMHDGDALEWVCSKWMESRWPSGSMCEVAYAVQFWKACLIMYRDQCLNMEGIQERYT